MHGRLLKLSFLDPFISGLSKLGIVFTNNRRIFGIVLTVFLVVVTFPGFYYPIQTSLDDSWRYALNYLCQSDYIFGRDVLFSYGPTGYLLYPLDIGSNLVQAVILYCILQVVFGLIVIYFVIRSKTLLPVFLFTLSYIFAYCLGLGSLPLFEYHFVLMIGFLSYICLTDATLIKYFAAFGASLLAGLCFFMKLNLGISTLSIIFVCTGIYLFTKKPNAKYIVTLILGTYLLIVFFLSKEYFGSLGYISTWVVGSLEIVRGYSTAMSIVGSYKILAIGFVGLLVYGIIVFLLFKKKSTLWYFGVLFVIPVILSFKHSFVRQDIPHMPLFFLFLLSVISAMILISQDRRELKVSIFSIVVVLMLALSVNWAVDALPSLSQIKTTSLGQGGSSNIISTIQLDNTRNRLSEASRVNLEEYLLPDEWLKIIGNASVDILPWDIIYIPANNLTWNPCPVLQNYSVYTSSLDLRSADHYKGDDSPSFLIVEFKDIDGRHPMLGAPATWNIIISNYDLLLEDQSNGRLLLKKKLDTSSKEVIPTVQIDSSTNQWITVPVSDNLLLADVQIYLSVVGAFTDTLFRIPPVYVDLIYQSGINARYRIIPDTARNGLLLSSLPQNISELAQLFQGKSEDSIAKFRISGPGTSYYQDKITILWKEAYKQVTTETPKNYEYVLAEGDTLFALDTINGRPFRQASAQIVVETQKIDFVTISGWAVDTKAMSTAAGVFITIDGQREVAAVYGLDRPDVADYFKENNYRFSGFSVTLFSSILDRGLHVLSLNIITADGKARYTPNQNIILNVR